MELLMLTHYNVSLIAVALFLVYAVSFFLYKTKRIRITSHRKVWNVLLLVTFLITGIFGLILAVRRDYVLLFAFPVNLLLWHVEAGVVMTVISLFHVSWHLSYYRDLLKTGRERVSAAREAERVQEAHER
jgi:amino acid transporter